MNLVKGCIIEVKEPVFSGSHRKPKYIGDRQYKAVIVNDNYSCSGQHTFTIEVLEVSGIEADKIPTKTTRKGRNLYPNIINVEYPEDYEKQAENKALRSEMNKSLLAVTRGY